MSIPVRDDVRCLFTPGQLSILREHDAEVDDGPCITGRPRKSVHPRAAYWRRWKQAEYQRRSEQIRERRRRYYHQRKRVRK